MINLRSKKVKVVVLLLAVTLAGCQVHYFTPPAQTSPTETKLQPTNTPPAEATVTATPVGTLPAANLNGLVIRVAYAWIDEQALAFEALADTFSLTNPWGFEVQPVRYPSCTEMAEAYREFGVSEDAALCWTADLEGLSSNGAWVNLAPFITDTALGVSGLYSAESLVNPLSQAGPSWTLPLAINPGLLYYNQTWARELGFENAPATPEELQEQLSAALQALLADENLNNNGTGGLWLSKTPLSALSWYSALGGKPKAEDGLPVFQPEALDAAFQYLKTLYETDASWVGALNTPYAYFADRFALAYEGDLSDLQLQEAYSSQSPYADQWVTIPYPNPSGSGSLAFETLSAAIRAGSYSQQLASWLFSRWLLSPEAQDVFVRAHWLWPAGGPPQASAPAYASEHAAWASAYAGRHDINFAPEQANWAVSRLLLQDAFQRVYGLEAQYFPQILEMLDQMLEEMRPTDGR